MRILGLNITRQKRSTELLSDYKDGHQHYLQNLLGVNVSVNETNSLSISAVYACARLIASTLACLPTAVLKDENGSRITDYTHPTHRLLSRKPNSYQTPFTFRELLSYQALLYGRAGALIIRDQNGYAKEAHVLPGRLGEKIYNDEVWYTSGATGLMRPSEVLVLENFAGKSPIRLHMENLGLSLNATSYGAEYFKNGGGQVGVLMTDSELSEPQFDRLKKDWNNASNPTKVLEKGIKFERIMATPEELQFLSTRKFQTEEVARIFGVPLPLIQGDGNTTYSNIEQLMNIYAQTTILPWVERYEQECEAKLLHAGQEDSHSVDMNLNSLLRADQKTLTMKINTLLRAGVYSFNEARAELGMNPIEDGDKHMVQLNQIPLADMDSYAELITKSKGNE